MDYANLPKELHDEIIRNMDTDSLIQFCHTSKKNCDNDKHELIKNNIINSLNTNYDISDLSVKNLMLLYKTTNLQRFLTISNNDVFYVKHPNTIIHYNIKKRQKQALQGINTDIYLIYVFVNVANTPILYIIDAHNNVFMLNMFGSLIEKEESKKIININYNSIDGTIFYNMDGTCNINNLSGVGNRNIELKDVIKKSGCFVLNMYGELYIELNNGYIYNPITKKYVNYNRYFDYSLYSHYKYHKLNIKNVKDVTIYGDILDDEGRVWRFDWNTMKINVIRYADIKQIQNYYNNKLYLIALLSNGHLYVEDLLISNELAENEYVTEIHIEKDKLIYLIEHRLDEIEGIFLTDNYITDIDLNTLESFTDKI